MIKYIRKRDGRVVPFENEKIEQAIENCFMASGTRKTQETARELTAQVIAEVERDENLPDTDLSTGMLETARKNTEHLHADYSVCDAMAIPYDNNSFDVVIANMMLYHVPDIDLALREIRRVWKPDGRFFAATFGEHGTVEAVLDMLRLPCTFNHRFTLQNGSAQLARYFSDIRLMRRDDALDIPHLPDLIAYLRSMQGMTVLADIPDENLLSVFISNMKDGVLSLPKEYGLFTCNRVND